jgi:glycosyltransferase involved in cell wall biosynthesis
MNILHVLRAPVGGLFRHVVDLAHGQIARGHKVGMITDDCTRDGPSKDRLVELAPQLALGLSRIPMRRIPSPADIAAVRHVARRIAETRAEVVHGHGAKGGALARLAPAASRPVRAYTPHGGTMHDAIGGRLFLMIERALTPQGNLYLFESGYSHDAFHRKVGRPHGIARVVHNGVHEAEFEPVALIEKPTDILFLGELRRLKGVDVLLDALATLHGAGRRLTASVVGNGPDRDAFRSQADRLGLGDAVQFHKAMPARLAFARGRLVVMPSRAESLPYVVMEAAAAGRPLVATNVGGIPEIFGPMADRLIPAGDAAALAKAIAERIDNPAAAERDVQALRARIADTFGAEAMVDAIIGAYHRAQESADSAECRHGAIQLSARAVARAFWPARS